MVHIKRWVIITFALLLFLIGLGSVWTPVPIGAILMTFATFLLIAYSRRGRALVRGARRRFALIDRQMRWFESKSKAKMVRVLKTTQPLESRLRYGIKKAGHLTPAKPPLCLPAVTHPAYWKKTESLFRLVSLYSLLFFSRLDGSWPKGHASSRLEGVKDCDLESQALGDHWLRLSVFAGRIGDHMASHSNRRTSAGYRLLSADRNSRAGRNMVRRMRKQIDWLRPRTRVA